MEFFVHRLQAAGGVHRVAGFLALEKEPAAPESASNESDNNDSGEASPGMNDLLTIEKLADLLYIKVSWLYAQTSTKKIPFLKLGGKLRFRKADVGGWLEGRVIQPVPIGSSSSQRARNSNSRAS